MRTSGGAGGEEPRRGAVAVEVEGAGEGLGVGVDLLPHLRGDRVPALEDLHEEALHGRRQPGAVVAEEVGRRDGRGG